MSDPTQRQRLVAVAAAAMAAELATLQKVGPLANGQFTIRYDSQAPIELMRKVYDTIDEMPGLTQSAVADAFRAAVPFVVKGARSWVDANGNPRVTIPLEPAVQAGLVLTQAARKL